MILIESNSLTEPTTQKYLALIDKLLLHFGADKFASEVKLAKADFFEGMSALDEKAENFNLRMSQFFDWYLLTRELPNYGQTCLEILHLQRDLRLSEEELEMAENLKKTRHSLFEFIKVKGDSGLYVKDLLKKEKLLIKNCPWTTGFDSEEIFEVRLIPIGDNFIFTRGFCFHPSDAKKFILSEVKKYVKNPDLDPDDLMLRLIKMRYKFERFRHVKVGMIYTNENKLGF